MRQTCYTLYGLRVDPGGMDFTDLDEAVGQVKNDGRVGYFQAGAHDREMTFLALTWRKVEPGEYVLHSGERPAASEGDRHRWNAALHAAAEELGMRVIDGPGWFTMPGEC